MRKLLLVLIGLAFIFGSCKKSSSDPVTATIDFLPLNVGTFWNYLSTTTTTTTTTSNFTLTVTNKDTTINAKTYKVLSNSAGANNYWTKVTNDYYRYGSVAGATFIGNVEELYLKDNLAANGTWTSSIPVTYNSIPLTITASYKIVATGQAKTVGSNSFTDVTQVHVDFSTSYLPFIPLTTLGGGDFYYAKGVGLVSQTISIAANTSLAIAASTVKWDLQTYSIK